jgi:hypothetical protein
VTSPKHLSSQGSPAPNGRQFDQAAAVRRQYRGDARAFQRDFQFAGLDPIRVRPMVLPAGGCVRSEMTECRLHARNRVHRALEALGGIGSPRASCLWHIVGCGGSITEWSIRQPWNGRPLDQKEARGILIAALGMRSPRHPPIRGHIGDYAPPACRSMCRVPLVQAQDFFRQHPPKSAWCVTY